MPVHLFTAVNHADNRRLSQPRKSTATCTRGSTIRSRVQATARTRETSRTGRCERTRRRTRPCRPWCRRSRTACAQTATRGSSRCASPAPAAAHSPHPRHKAPSAPAPKSGSGSKCGQRGYLLALEHQGGEGLLNVVQLRLPYHSKSAWHTLRPTHTSRLARLHPRHALHLPGMRQWVADMLAVLDE